MIRVAMVAMVLAGPAVAQTATAELRPTPDYFAEAVFDMSMAQALARSCRTVSVNLAQSAARADTLLGRLSEDGFEPTTPYEQMEDPNAAIEALQLAFVERYALESPSEERVCEIAMTEMSEDSGIGQLLIEVPG